MNHGDIDRTSVWTTRWRDDWRREELTDSFIFLGPLGSDFFCAFQSKLKIETQVGIPLERCSMKKENLARERGWWGSASLEARVDHGDNRDDLVWTWIIAFKKNLLKTTPDWFDDWLWGGKQSRHFLLLLPLALLRHPLFLSSPSWINLKRQAHFQNFIFPQLWWQTAKVSFKSNQVKSDGKIRNQDYGPR